ncbi:hypothetical protein GTR02_14430, partial [Kineococcus sp. R8]|uniref:hypothetical protein n=1 Tax=Kineococcus siccus TaxID=2696567 RepID=UPI00141324BD
MTASVPAPGGSGPAQLPTEVLLLALAPRCRCVTRGPVELVLAGALLCEELLAGGRPVPRSRWAGSPVLERSATALGEVVGPAERAGLVERDVHRVLGLVARRGFGVRAVDVRDRARERLLDALRPGGRPADARAAALAVLCAVSGTARHHAPPPAGRPGVRAEAARAQAAHLNALAVALGPEIAAVLVATREAYGRRGDGEPVVDGDAGPDGGYGDC